MRSTFSVLISTLLLALTVAPVRAAPEEMRVDPYERLYGRTLAVHSPLAPGGISLPQRAAEQMASRTEVLLRRMGAFNATSLAGSSRIERDARFEKVADRLAENAQRSRNLLSEGRYEAAYLEANGYAYAQELIGHFLDSFGRLSGSTNTQWGDAETPWVSRIPEARDQMLGFHLQLRAFQPKTASQLLALLNAYAEWHDTQVLLDLLDKHPRELIALLKKEFSLTELDTAEKEQLLLRLVVEPFVLPLVRLVIEDAKFQLQLSQIDSGGSLPPLTRRIEEAQLRQLSTAYGEAAKWNFSRLEALAAGRTLPREDPFDASWRTVEAIEIMGRQQFAQDHRDDFGLDPTFRLLAANFRTYIDSLYSLATLQVRLIDAEGLAGSDSNSKTTTTPAGDRLLDKLLRRAGLQARRAAAGAQAELGYVPTPVALELRGGLDASSGDRDDRKRALGYAIKAAAEADLVRALSSPPPCPEGNETNCLGLSTPRDLSAEILDCIQRLRDTDNGVVEQAKGFARKRRSAIPEAEVADIVHDAIVETCFEAEERGEAVRGLFWLKYRNRLADWYRDVEVYERNAPRLFSPCISRPDEEFFEHEQAARYSDRIRQVLCDIDDKDRQIIELHINQGKTFPQIGFLLGLTASGAEKRFNRAAERFRKRWGKPPEFGLLPTKKLMNFASL